MRHASIPDSRIARRGRPLELLHVSSSERLGLRDLQQRKYVSRDALEITQGKDILECFQPSDAVTRSLCRDCGPSLFFHHNGAENFAFIAPTASTKIPASAPKPTSLSPPRQRGTGLKTISHNATSIRLAWRIDRRFAGRRPRGAIREAEEEVGIPASAI